MLVCFSLSLFLILVIYGGDKVFFFKQNGFIKNNGWIIVNNLFKILILDFNECESQTRQYCDYNCVNKIGGYECSCPKGYRLMGEDCVGKWYFGQTLLGLGLTLTGDCVGKS